MSHVHWWEPERNAANFLPQSCADTINESKHFSWNLQNWKPGSQLYLVQADILPAIPTRDYVVSESDLGYYTIRIWSNGTDGIYSERHTCWYLSGSSMYPIMIPRLWSQLLLTKSALSSINICCNIERTKELLGSLSEMNKNMFTIFLYQ